MYLWFVIVGAVFAFTYGFGTGSNDVANAFGTSVGSKTLTMRQAVVIAFIFEFTGAIVLGRVSTNTIAGGVADVKQFTRNPDIYAYGMMISLGVAGFLQILASYLELNISATHSIIGCIMGFSLVFKGKDGVLWAVKDNSGDSFPPYKGVVPIFFSWVISPVLTGLTSALIFTLCRTLVLRRNNPAIKSLLVLPCAVFLTTWVNVYFVFTKGAKKMLTEDADNWSDHKAAIIAVYSAAGATFLTSVIAIPLIYKKANEKHSTNTSNTQLSENNFQDVELQPHEHDNSNKRQYCEFLPDKAQKIVSKVVTAVAHSTSYDIHKHIDDDELVSAMHKAAEVFDPKSEYIFSFLQVFSAICVVFAHGAGEVGYMAGPLAAIWENYENGRVSKKVTPPIWIVLIGAFGLVFGLSLYGYKVTKSMGIKLSKLSPSRGFAAELATSLTIMIASQYGLPTSSSQCITGGIVGIGLMEGMKGVNWRFFAIQATSWVVNLFLSLSLVAAIFSQGIYTPSINQSRDLTLYQNDLTTLSLSMLNTCNATTQFRPSVKNLAKVPVASPEKVIDVVNTTFMFWKNNTC